MTFRRSSRAGAAVLLAAALLLFLPLAMASNSARTVQTVTIVALLNCLIAVALLCATRGRRRVLPPWQFGLVALIAGVATFLGSLPVFGRDQLQISVRLSYTAVFNALGLWLFVISLRLIFPRHARPLAAVAFVLVFIGVFPGPTLLLQPSYRALNLLDIETQMRAGLRYWTVGTALLVAPFLALATLPGDWFERAWDVAVARIRAISDRTFLVGLAVVTAALALVFAFYSFDGRPTTADEIAQLWHAHILLSGRLALPADPNPEFFAIDNVIDRPLWMSQFPIGGPAVLALGLVVRATWLLNPLFTALTAANVYRFARRAYGEAQARAAGAMFAASPMVLLMGGTYMNHMPTAWLITLALAALPVWVASSRSAKLHRSAIVIGGAIGAAVAIRPLDGVVAALVIGCVMLALASRDFVHARVRSILVAIGVGFVPIALLLIANWRTTGNPFRFGYEVLWGPNHSLGLHDDPTGHPHTPWRALLLGVKYATQLNWITMIWPVPLLLILASGLILARRPNRWDVLLLALFFVHLVVYTFYWHDGQFIGPRFLFSVVPALLILTARAPFIASRQLSGVARRIALMVIPVCIGVAWLRSMRPFGVQGLAKEFRESRSRLKLDPPVQVRNGTVGQALIFVQEGAATRLLHRLWGVGVSRADAARLLTDADACSLFDAVRAEERRASGDTAGRLLRVTTMARPFRRSTANLHLPDPNFHVTDTTSLTPACADEANHDLRVRNTVAYGPMLLFNHFDRSGRIAGSVIYVLDLAERNEVLRKRFGDLTWFRYEQPRESRDTVPVLVPYDSAR